MTKSPVYEYEIVPHNKKFHVYYDLEGRLSDEAISTHDTRADATAAMKRYQAADKRRAAPIAKFPPCTYPNCKCIVSTSTSKPEPDCPKGLTR